MTANPRALPPCDGPSLRAVDSDLEAANRRALLSRVRNHFARAPGAPRPRSLALALFELVVLDRIADSGDTETRLAEAMSRVSDHAPAGASVARYARDQLALLMTDQSLEEARAEVGAILEGSDPEPGRAETLRLRGGIASSRAGVDAAETLVREAELALEHQRQLGGIGVSASNEIDLARVWRKFAIDRVNRTDVAGRPHRLAPISEALQRLQGGASGVVALEGLPGVGKEMLFDALERRLVGAGSFRVARAGISVPGPRRPFELLERALERLTGKARPESSGADLAERLREELAQATARERPAVILLDAPDALDQESLDVITDVLRAPQAALLVCSRQESTETDCPWSRFVRTAEGVSVERIRLLPLTEDDVSEYLAGVFPALAFPRSLPRELSRITEGRPLFVREAVRAFALDGWLRFDSGRFEIPPVPREAFPDSLDELIRNRLVCLGSDEIAWLRDVSEIGYRFDLSAAVAETGVDEPRSLSIADRASALGLIEVSFRDECISLRFPSAEARELLRASTIAVSRHAAEQEEHAAAATADDWLQARLRTAAVEREAQQDVLQMLHGMEADAFPLLADLVRHPDVTVARGAIGTLATLGSPYALGALTSTLQVAREPERLIACAEALARLRNPDAVPSLEEVVNAEAADGTELPGVRASAALALARIGGERARRVLARCTTDWDPSVREIALAGCDSVDGPVATSEGPPAPPTS